MKKIIVLIAFVVSAVAGSAENVELHELIYSAKSKNKFILLKIFHSETSFFPFDSVSFADRFIETSLYASNPSVHKIITEYGIETYPSIILLNSNGHLILPVKTVDNLSEVEVYMEQALKVKYDSKPVAQLDLEYRNNKMNKAALYEYIGKRTALNLDNSDIIDKYTQSATANDLLNRKTLLLFINENSFNIPGAFCTFIEQNQEDIKQILKLGDERFNRLTEKSIEYNFRKICRNRDESALQYIINMKINASDAGYGEVVYNEYMTRYFHATCQPLKLVDQAREYVNAILKYKDLKEQDLNETKLPVNNKLLFSPSFKNSAVETVCASKLRDAAQYIVEIMSAKAILTTALSWSMKAEELAGENKSNIYETQAYILYKLGKRDEAIENMEKACNAIPEKNIEQMKITGFNLIKMKRGEKIY
jgi:hypothetical protein